MNPVAVAGLAVAGLVVGWGMRSVVFRYAVPPGDLPRGACPVCEHPLAAARRRAVPTGDPPRGARPACEPPVAAARRVPWPPASPFARCPACRARVGPPPLAVELTTAALFGALAARVHPGLVLAAACWLAACAVPLAFIDAAVQRLPDLLTGPAYAGTVIFLLLAATAGEPWGDLVRAVAGGLALAVVYLAVTVVSRSALGLGDVKLAASLGTLLAWPGWRWLLAGTFAGFLLGAVFGAGLLLARRATRTQRIPFGPFMIAGAFLTLLAS